MSSLTFSSLNMPVMKDDGDTLAIRKLANDIVTDLNQLGAAITSTSSASATAGNIINPLPARPSGNVTYAVPSTSGIYQIYIPSSYLVATSGGPFTLTLNTSKNAASVVVPIGASVNTISSGNLFFNIYVDASGNVTSDAWEISGSNSNGSYEQRSNGEMICRQSVTMAANTDTAITFPIPFISSTYQTTSMGAHGAGWGTSAQWESTVIRTSSSITVIMNTSAGSPSPVQYDFISIGRWRT